MEGGETFHRGGYAGQFAYAPAGAPPLEYKEYLEKEATVRSQGSTAEDEPDVRHMQPTAVDIRRLQKMKAEQDQRLKMLQGRFARLKVQEHRVWRDVTWTQHLALQAQESQLRRQAQQREQTHLKHHHADQEIAARERARRMRAHAIATKGAPKLQKFLENHAAGERSREESRQLAAARERGRNQTQQSKVMQAELVRQQRMSQKLEKELALARREQARQDENVMTYLQLQETLQNGELALDNAEREELYAVQRLQNSQSVRAQLLTQLQADPSVDSEDLAARERYVALRRPFAPPTRGTARSAQAHERRPPRQQQAPSAFVGDCGGVASPSSTVLGQIAEAVDDEEYDDEDSPLQDYVDLPAVDAVDSAHQTEAEDEAEADADAEAFAVACESPRQSLQLRPDQWPAGPLSASPGEVAAAAVAKVTAIWGEFQHLPLRGEQWNPASAPPSSPRTAGSQECSQSFAKERLEVSILGARGLRHLDFLGSSPFCVCELKRYADRRSRPSTRIQTMPAGRTLDPCWNETHELDPWQQGDDLEFTVYDQGRSGSRVEATCLLRSHDFFPEGFDGEVLFATNGEDAAGNAVAAALRVCIVFAGPSLTATQADTVVSQGTPRVAYE